MSKFGIIYQQNFNYWLRFDLVNSIPGRLLFVLIIINYFYCKYFINTYNNSHCSIRNNYFTSSFTMMVYAKIVYFIDTIYLIIIVISLILKAIGLFSLIFCPKKILWLKKNLQKPHYSV
jgi:hypothetical protein